MKSTPDRPEAEADDDPRVVAATKEYLAELEAGRRPNRAEFVARFPGLADDLAPYLDALDMVHGAASASRGPRRPAPDVPPPVEPLGDFHIVREIGRGGMGVVYEAVQLSLGRRVALKVLPFAAALDARQLQRFKNEAQAAAQLHHTNIVPVYAVGCERGTHYYAMQLIEGQNLADMIGRLRAADPDATRSLARIQGPAASFQGPKPASGVRAALPSTGPELAKPGEWPAPPAAETAHAPAADLATQHSTRSTRFYQTVARIAIQAADALEYAHQFGVIHRDVKPANLIVDERGNVWVTDFGLAQFHSNQNLTRTGDMMGTLRYMSPEQAGGNHALLDARADVYSLGATLYELLTLRPMFGGTDAQRLLRQILNDEPRPLRALERTVPAELETIVLKAVSKSPSDRYATAREFADDLRRYLDNRPIRARPPSLAQRLGKLARRHPSVVISAVVLCVLTAIGSLISLAMIHQAYERERKANEEERKAREAESARAEQAEKGLQLARQSADELIEISQQELAGKPGMEDARKRMLMAALDYYRNMIDLSRDDPQATEELEFAQQHAARILSDLALTQAGSRLDLLRRGDVKQDLAGRGLTDDQLRRVDDALGRLSKGGPDPSQLGLEEREQRQLDEARAKDDALNILTVDQRQRLEQIRLQLKPGLSAFHDPDVARQLNLTDKQKDFLRSVESANFPPPPRRGGPPGFTDWFQAEQSWEQSLREKFLAGLTEEQRQGWKNLTGEAFHPDPPQPNFDFRRPPWDQHRDGPPGGPGPDRKHPPSEE